MKLGNIVPTAGIEPVSLAIQASMLVITSPRPPDVTNVSTTTSVPVYAAPCLRGQCRLLH